MPATSGDHSVSTIDCRYMGIEKRAAAYLLIEGGRAAFVDNNTPHAVPLLLETLQGAGLTPEQVDFLIVTHVHLDHAGGTGALLRQCPNATVLAHPRAARHLIDPARLIAGAKAVYGEETFAHLYGVIDAIPEARVRSMEDNEELAWRGRLLRFLHVRGHANHHFCIYDSGSNAVFSGDAFGIGRSAELRPGPPFLIAATAPTEFEPALAVESVRRIVATGAEAVYVSHFGRFGDMKDSAEQLIQCIHQLDEIVEEAVARKLEGEALDRFCAEQTAAALAEQLRICGVADFDADWRFIENDVGLNAMGLAYLAKKRMRAS